MVEYSGISIFTIAPCLGAQGFSSSCWETDQAWVVFNGAIDSNALTRFLAQLLELLLCLEFSYLEHQSLAFVLALCRTIVKKRGSIIFLARS